MTSAEVVRSITAPAAVKALQEAADALDAMPGMEATISGLETSLADKAMQLAAALDRIRELEAQLPALARFPGDPGVGKAIVGLATTRGDLAQLQSREQTVGMGLAFRVYDNGGIADLGTTGSVRAKIKRDQAAGRVTVCSPKPGIEALAAHKYGPELEAFFAFTEAQPGLTIVAVHHEPENDWKADHGNLPAMAKHAADYRAAQQWVRECLNKAAGGRPKRTVFIGSLLTYSWTAQGKAKFGPTDQWNPGLTADGRHVWDVACGDHYEPSYTAKSLDTLKWRDFVKSVTSWGCLPGLTELGLNQGNTAAGGPLAAFLKLAVERDGCPIVLYFDSKAGAGGALQPDPRDWWVLTDTNGTLPAFTDFARSRGVNPNKGA